MLQRRAQATPWLGRGAGEVARAWWAATVHPCIVPAVARPTRRKDANQQNCNRSVMASHSWCPVNSLQPIQPIPTHPQKEPPHPYLPAAAAAATHPSSSTFANHHRVLHFSQSHFTTEAASSPSPSCSSTSSPRYIIILAAPDEGHPPPDTPRPCQKEASLSLIAILHRLSPNRGASHPSFLLQRSPLTEHNNPTPTARPLGLICARCAPFTPSPSPEPQD